LKDLFTSAQDKVIRAAKNLDSHRHTDEQHHKYADELGDALGELAHVEKFSITECLVGVGAITLGLVGVSFLATRK